MVMYFEYINKKIIILKYFYMCLIQFNNVFIVLMRYLVRNLSLKELIPDTYIGVCTLFV